jgi:hypothetical protein
VAVVFFKTTFEKPRKTAFVFVFTLFFQASNNFSGAL